MVDVSDDSNISRTRRCLVLSDLVLVLDDLQYLFCFLETGHVFALSFLKGTCNKAEPNLYLCLEEHHAIAHKVLALIMGFNLTPIVIKRKLTLDDIRERNLAVDANNELYQFLSLIRTRGGIPLKDSEGRVTSHLTGLLFRATRLIHDYGLRLCFVFDGKPPALKERTISARREARAKARRLYEDAVQHGDFKSAWSKAVVMSSLTQPMIEDAKTLLRLLGIPLIQAPSEGEAQAAYMAKMGDVWAANSRDYDSILFGAPRLLRYVTISGTEFLPSKGIARPLEPELIEQASLLSHLRISLPQLIDLAILVGTDFNEGVPGIGPKTALKLLKAHENLESLPPDIRSKLPENYNSIREIFLEPKVEPSYMLSFSEPDERGLYEFLCDQRGFSKQRVEIAVKRMQEAFEGNGGLQNQQTLDTIWNAR